MMNNGNSTLNEQRWAKIIVLVSIAVPVLVAVLFKLSPPQATPDFNFKLLPKLHALINATVTVLLLLSWRFVKRGQIRAHKSCNIAALVLSALFLVSYVIYHTFSESTVYGGEGLMKAIYLFILLTHIVLAALILPLILFTFMRAFAGKYPQHRRLARWAMPLWLYVSVTGVVVYLMISPYY